ncbi:MAG: imidazole glycerol phosphate synthase, glutamine amidotransferase subunit [Deltaproteobacteria bacterium GWA2_47_9]|nr:MAG: imidazole glycerol phosphate synthase, glutamine amidotransferase subunit [Deltaproteobacteria bacterium GWA2_47_9]
MGNLRSVQKGFEKVGHKAIVTSDPATIMDASHVVLPGVGAFPDCMRNLDEKGLLDIVPKVINSGKPFLGICLGLQLLFTESEEFGIHKGLDIIKGRVVKFDFSAQSLEASHLKVPHMGWNTVAVKRRPPAMEGIDEGAYFYFVHSYYVVPEDEKVVATTTAYGVEFASSIWKDNLFATQFHPEKSQEKGLRILKNFGDIKG